MAGRVISSCCLLNAGEVERVLALPTRGAVWRGRRAKGVADRTAFENILYVYILVVYVKRS